MLPHFVKESDLAKAGARGKAGRREGHRRSRQGLPGSRSRLRRRVRHSRRHPLLPGTARPRHPVAGRPGQWRGPPPRTSPARPAAWPPTSRCPPPTSRSKMDYIGGGFGSKFTPDAWAEVGANLSKKAGGTPVKLFLDRATEQMIAGNRPSRLRQDQGRRQEGRHHHRLAVRHLGHRRFRRRRPASPALRLSPTFPTPRAQPRLGLGQRRPAARLARARTTSRPPT